MSKNENLDSRYSDMYDAEAAKYDKRSFASSRGSFSAQYKNELAIDFLEKYGALHDTSLILDCPSGTGRITHAIVSSGKPFGHIDAVDISQGMLKVNQDNLPAHRDKVTFTTVNMKQMDFEDNYFDAVVIASFAYLVPMAEYKDYVADIHRVLKPGGIAIIEVSNAFCAYSPISFVKVLWHRFVKRKKVKSFATAWELRRIFSPFEVAEYKGVEFPLIVKKYKFYETESRILGGLPILKWFSGKFTVVLRKNS